MSKLALLGGNPEITDVKDIFHWPIVNRAMEDAVVQVLRDGNMSGTDISRKLEEGFADWHNRKYALAHNNGTSSVLSAMYGVGLGVGDELICPSLTYWASAVQALSLGASVVFADVDPETWCISPQSFEEHITSRTKAVMVVHMLAHPADMDPIMAIARKYGIKVIEDVSHAQGGLYKGRLLGTFGDVAAMSLMSAKSFAIGEGGMLLTDDPEIFRRAARYGHYERIFDCYQPEEYADTGALPVGGMKNRMHQMSAAVGLEQLKKYDSEIAEIDQAMKYFWAGLEGCPGIRMHYPKFPNSNKAGWFATHAHFNPDELDGLSVTRFVAALVAEGFTTAAAGCYALLHKSELFYSFDVYGDGKPTATRNLPPDVDLRKLCGDFPVADTICNHMFTDPPFRRFDKAVIDNHIAMFRKVIENYKDLLPGDEHAIAPGNWFLSARKH